MGTRSDLQHQNHSSPEKIGACSGDDTWITATKSVTAPQGSPVFSRDWKSYKSIILSETAGISRTREPVEALLAFYPDEAQQLAT